MENSLKGILVIKYFNIMEMIIVSVIIIYFL